jgi:hypothetical protein
MGSAGKAWLGADDDNDDLGFGDDFAEMSKPRLSNDSPSAIIEEFGAKRATMRDLFGNDTCFASIAYNEYFGNLTLLVISINALWIGYDVQMNHDNVYSVAHGAAKGAAPPMYFFFVETAFVVFFSFELFVRFFAFRNKCHCYKDLWFVFDSVLVILMLLEFVVAILELVSDGAGVQLPGFTIFRMLRLFRLTRLTRLMRACPELLIFCKGMVAAIQGSVGVVFFIFMLMFFWSILFTSVLTDNRPEAWRACFPGIDLKEPSTEECVEDDVSLDGPYGGYTAFKTFGDSMCTLFTQGVLGDNLNQAMMFCLNTGYNAATDSIDPLGYIIHWGFIIFITLSSMIMLNMLIGVLCEVITEAKEKEEEARQEQMFKETLQEAFEELDKSHDGVIQREEWKGMKTNEKVKKAFVALGLEMDDLPSHLDALEDTIFPDDDFAPLEFDDEHEVEKSNGLPITEFSKQVLQLRPSACGEELDIELLRLNLGKQNTQLQEKMTSVQDQLVAIVDEGLPKTCAQPGFEKLDPPPWLQDVPHDVLLQVIQKRCRAGA